MSADDARPRLIEAVALVTADVLGVPNDDLNRELALIIVNDALLARRDLILEALGGESVPGRWRDDGTVRVFDHESFDAFRYSFDEPVWWFPVDSTEAE